MIEACVAPDDLSPVSRKYIQASARHGALGARDDRARPALRRSGRAFEWAVPAGVQLRRAGRRLGDRPQPRRALLGGRGGPDRRGSRSGTCAQASNRAMNALAGARRPARRSGARHAAARAGVARRRWSPALKLGALVIPCTVDAAREGHRVPRRGTAARAPSSPPLEQAAEVDARAGGDAAGPDRARRRAGGLARLGRRCSRAPRPPASPARTRSDEPALCFYTSGTTKDPKAVLHAHAYTFAHRWTGEYWLDLQRTDLHWTTADTGWAKAAYGVLFGPWMNGVADVHVPRPLRSRARARPARALRGLHLLRAADRVSAAGEAGPGAPAAAAAPPLRRRRRAAQPRGDPRLARCASGC